MSLEEKRYDIEANNDWAKNVKGEELFIDAAKSGRRGYYCIGCDKEMEAVIKKKNPKHRSYFRHVPVDISKDETPCTFSNRKYRETLATDILQRLKSIKVPSIYKYPPKGVEGMPILLEKAKYIIANKVKSQLTFYEDSEGVIKYGRNPEVEDRFLLIRPDVIFFDIKNNPILFIELVITHKVSDEKKIKLRRLGIDTVSIIVPKSSAQEIEDNFKTTKRVKWEYNGKEADTKYVPVSSGTSEGVLEFDTDQRRIFQESISCRKSRLNNTLRTIEKCLRSESYRRSKQLFESEISRITTATKAERNGLEDMESRFEKEVYAQFKAQFNDIERELKVIKKGRAKLEQQSQDLETRYFNKRRELDQEEADISRRIREHSYFGEFTEEIRRKFRGRRITIEREIETIKGEIERVEREVLELSGKVEQSEKREIARDDEEGRELEEKQREIESEINGNEELSKEEERKLELEYNELGKQAIERINKRDSTGDSELSKRIGAVLEIRGICNCYDDRLQTFKRYRAYLELARSRAWKK